MRPYICIGLLVLFINEVSIAEPTVDELLDKYTQALDSTQSFVSTWESSQVCSWKVPGWVEECSNKKVLYRGEYRTDNKGYCYSREYHWGYFDPKHPNLTEENAFYRQHVIGEDFTYQHNRLLDKQSGNVEYRQKGTKKWDDPDRKTWGYFDGNETNNLFLGYFHNKARLDRVLKMARRISVRKKPETINGSPCYVIEADTYRGQYRVWLDSAHGYHPAKIEARIDIGDDIGDPGDPHIITPEEGLIRRFTLENVRFEKIDDIWVPMEADRVNNFSLKPRNAFSLSEIHFKRLNIILNPDHEALESFADPMKNPELDPKLCNGSRISLGDGSEQMWQDGKIVPLKKND